MRPRFRSRLWTLMALIAAVAITLLVVRERTDWVARYRVWMANRTIRTQLERPIPMRFPEGVQLSNVLRHVRNATTTTANPRGLPIFIDPIGLQEAGQTMGSAVKIDAQGIPLKKTLRMVLDQVGLSYYVKDGLLLITAQGSEDE